MGSYHLHVSAFLVEDTIGRAFVWGFDVQNKRKTRTSLSLKCSNTDAPKFGGHSFPGLCLLWLIGASSFTSACPFLTNWDDLFLLSYIFWRELLVMVYWRASSFFFRLFCLQMGFSHQQVDTLTWAPGGLCQFEKTGWAGLGCGVGFERVFWKVWWRRTANCSKPLSWVALPRMLTAIWKCKSSLYLPRPAFAWCVQ